MPSTATEQNSLPVAKFGATCVPVEGVPSNIFGLKIPGKEEVVLFTKRRTRKWSACAQLNAAAKRLPLQEQATVWECCDEHHHCKNFPAKNEAAHHLPSHCLFVGDLPLLQEERQPRRQKTRPQRASGTQNVPPKQNDAGPSTEVFVEEEEEPQRKHPEVMTFDPKPLAERQQIEKAQDDPLVQTMGFSEEEIKLLSKASEKLSRFSVKNIHKPWLSRHCRMLGKDRVVAVLKESVSNLHNQRRKSRPGRV